MCLGRSGKGWEERAVHLHKLQRSREGDDRRWEECDVWVEINNLELTHFIYRGGYSLRHISESSLDTWLLSQTVHIV